MDELNVHPADRALSLPAGRHSHGLRRLAVTEAVRGSYNQAKAAIERRCGKILGKRHTTLRLTDRATQDIAAFYRHQLVLPATANTRLVLQVDGKGIVMRSEALRPATFKAHQAARRAMRTRLAPGEKPHRKRMATLACVFDATPSPRRPHDIVAPSTGRSHERAETGAEGHGAMAHRLGCPPALSSGWPIATGAIEGACRHLIGDRLDITGARWGLAGAEAILKLRALSDNGDFDEYWTHHLAREHERLYLALNQHRYQLTT